MTVAVKIPPGFGSGTDASSGRGAAWRTHLIALACAWVAILALFFRDAAHLVSVWWTMSTFNHCLLILPIIAWLVWQRVPQLRLVAPAAWPAGLALVALGAAAWLLGQAESVTLARHAGLIVMLQGAAIACLGKAAARGLAFPLFYALFLIPAGEQLVPALQTLTARMATALLGLSGVPAHLEGVFITTPRGYFEVAEACAGVKFLIAMVALGVLVANVGFRSWRRRIAFVAASVAVPILANGVRAWGTIHIAQSAGLEFAASFDHVVYGGIFFAVVAALVLGLAWRFFDRGIDDPWFDPARLRGNRPARPAWVAGAAILVAALPLLWSSAVSGRWAWSADALAPPGGRAERIASHGVAREVVSFYPFADVLTGSGARVKFETMKVRLLGGRQRAEVA